MAVVQGQRLGPYEIESLLGVGGMGEVYKARDTRLDRAVALKVLPTELAGGPERRQRFEREARAISSLEHPHICTLHDIGEQDGTPFLVMELLEGESLRDRLSHGPLPLDVVLKLSIQAADALDAAHAQGIVHRDLKPANLFVTERQGLKVLDFGVARQLTAHGLAASLTTTAAAEALLTSPGLAVGTVLYMSPEQARGEEVDTRSDLFSLGAVMYEMSTGQHPFQGNSVGMIYDAILNRPPQRPTLLNSNVPPELERIILKALEKERALRYQTAAEVVGDLKRLKRETSSAAEPSAVTRSKQRPRMVWFYPAGAGLLAVLGIALTLTWPRSALVPATAWERITDFADAAGSPALSPDGRMATFLRGPRTFTTPGQVYMMVLPKGPAVQLTHDGLEKMDPVFSPDGSSILYTVPWDTWTVPVFGGRPRLWLPNASGLTWAADNGVLFSEIFDTPHMRIVTADASRTKQRPVYTPAGRDAMTHRSYLSPNRKWVLVAAEMVNGPPWEWLPCRLVPFDGASPARVVGPPDAACTSGAWSPDGNWMYVSSNAGGAYHVWRQRFPDGRPEQVTSGATEEEGIALSPDGASFITAVGTRRVAIAVRDRHGERSVISQGRPALALPENGSPFSLDGKKLYYLQLPRNSNAVGSSMLAPFLAGELWRVDLETGETELVLPGLSVTTFSFAPDGHRIALTVVESGRPRLWVADLNSRLPPRRLPVAWGSMPRFATEYVYYVALENGRPSIRRIRPDGRGDEHVWNNDVWSTAISPDGRYLALRSRGAQETAHRRTLRIVEWKTGGTRLVCHGCNGWWSDDGAWFALATVTGSGENTATYLLPTRPDSSLPDLPSHAFEEVSDAAHVRGARVIREPGDIALGRSPDTYALMRETVHRNLYRIPVP